MKDIIKKILKEDLGDDWEWVRQHEVTIYKKDDFKINDLVVFVEPDSILPEKPEFEFLRNKKFHIKTIKLRGQISQGICFPLSILPEGEYVVNVMFVVLLDNIVVFGSYMNVISSKIRE